jgi:uncharacterized phiE125 gp8 family phage protein
MNALLLITPPALEPVTIAEAKAHCRVDGAQDDALLTSLIVAARLVAEIQLSRALLTQTLRLLCDDVPEGDILELPRAPLQSITHVKTYDDADVATTYAAANYFADTANQPGRLVLRQGSGWPQPGRHANGFEVQYVAGYGSSASDVPMPIRQGILAHVAHLYRHRGDDLQREGQPDPRAIAVPNEALALFAPYRIMRGVT